MSRYGLTCDNLASADVVTAEGKLLVANSGENEDLFWGIRGGGGNFGVVTSFKMRLHEVSKVLGGSVVYPLARAREVLAALRDLKDMPDALGIGASLRRLPDGTEAVGIGVCYTGDLEEGESLVAPLREIGKPIADMIRPMAYETLQKQNDALWPPGLCCYWKSGFFETLSDSVVEAIATYAESKPSPLSVMMLPFHHGAATKVASNETAFSHRAKLYHLNIQAQWRDPADTEKNLRWIREFWSSVEPFTTGGVYVNFLSQEGDERVRAAYGENYDRLVALKNKYDPTNFFRFNQNIKPSPPRLHPTTLHSGTAGSSP